MVPAQCPRIAYCGTVMCFKRDSFNPFMPISLTCHHSRHLFLFLNTRRFFFSILCAGQNPFGDTAKSYIHRHSPLPLYEPSEWLLIRFHGIWRDMQDADDVTRWKCTAVAPLIKNPFTFTIRSSSRCLYLHM